MLPATIAAFTDWLNTERAGLLCRKFNGTGAAYNLDGVDMDGSIPILKIVRLKIHLLMNNSQILCMLPTKSLPLPLCIRKPGAGEQKKKSLKLSIGLTHDVP